VLKITTVQENEKCCRIRLCGEFTSEYVAELERSFAEYPPACGAITLDMANVTFVDREAMVFLCAARSKNVSIENVPSYVRRWIEQEKRCGSFSTKNSPEQ
jgi:ABC-type transporter Mla MlaB component